MIYIIPNRIHFNGIYNPCNIPTNSARRNVKYSYWGVWYTYVFPMFPSYHTMAPVPWGHKWNVCGVGEHNTYTVCITFGRIYERWMNLEQTVFASVQIFLLSFFYNIPSRGCLGDLNNELYDVYNVANLRPELKLLTVLPFIVINLPIICPVYVHSCCRKTNCCNNRYYNNIITST